MLLGVRAPWLMPRVLQRHRLARARSVAAAAWTAGGRGGGRSTGRGGRGDEEDREQRRQGRGGGSGGRHQQRQGQQPQERYQRRRPRDGGGDEPGLQAPDAGGEEPLHQYSYVVTCHPGLESAVMGELSDPRIGAKGAESKQPGRVTFWGESQAAGYRAALWLRSGTRVLQLVAAEALDPRRAAGDTVYEAARRLLDWPLLLRPGGTVGVTSQVWGCGNVTNSQLVGRRVRDAACDAVRDERGVRPAPPGDFGADLPVHAALLYDTLYLYRDLGGGSLHRRGYRQGEAIHKAALNEAAAAGLLLLAGWHQRCRADEGAVFADPMCGSGTFLVEAALIATDTAPGLLRRAQGRRLPFEGWHDFEPAAWRAAVEDAEGARRRWGGAILGNDVHDGALRLARSAVEAAGVGGLVSLHQGECGAWRPRRAPAFVATNPPWGGRLLGGDGADSRGGGVGGDRQRGLGRRQHGGGGSTGGGGGGGGGMEGEGELVAAWDQLSAFLKGECPGADAWVLSGAPELTSALGMRSFKKRSVAIGGVKTAWLGYAVRGRDEEAQ